MRIERIADIKAPERQLRRHFALPEEDVELLDASGLPWETVMFPQNGQQVLWVFVHDVPVPRGLEARDLPDEPLVTVTMAFRVTGYPGGALDMVYVCPPLARVNRRPIGALSDTRLDGVTFQQWSRHYAFDSASHSLFGHFRTAQSWLEKEASE